MSSNSDNFDEKDYEKSDKSSSNSRSSIRSKSSSSFKKRIEKLKQAIKSKKNLGEPHGRESRTLEVLQHKKRIADEQKDYVISIEKAPNSQELYEKLVNTTRV